jgi:hypothetical protein
MGEAILSAAEVETLTRGNMHIDAVAKETYDIRNAKAFKTQAVKIFVNKLLPAALRTAKRKEQLSVTPAVLKDD